MRKIQRICQLAAVAVPLVSIQPNVVTPPVGSSFNVFVNVSSVADLFAFQFNITFNPNILSGVDVTEGSFLGGAGTTFFIRGTIDNTAGTISFTSDSLIGLLTGVTGTGTLAEITFSALAQGNSPINLSGVVLLDSGLNDIAFETAAGSVNPVQTAVAEPESAVLVLLGLGVILWVRT